MKTSIVRVIKLLTLVSALFAFSSFANATPVTFWFSGTVWQTANPSNAMPLDIKAGTRFSGRWSFDSAIAGYKSGIVEPAGIVSNFYCTQLSGCSTLVQIGSHIITNAAVIPSTWSGSLHIYDDINNADELVLYAGQSGLMVDGVIATNSSISLHLLDGTKTAFSSAQSPTNPPNLAAFGENRSFTWSVRNSANKQLYTVYGELTSISTNELVSLNIRNAGPDAAQVSWPVGVSGLTLQATTNLNTDSWQDVDEPVSDIEMEHTVAISTVGTPKFYRLKK